MIQILGLRPFTDKNGVEKLYDAYHDKGWRAPDIYDLFLNIETYVKMIPEDMRWNLYYTVANCTDKKRIFGDRQDVIPVDIDGIEPGSEDRIVEVVCKELGLDPKDLGIVYSGNGVHILIGLVNPITTASYINQNKVYYRAFAGRVNLALYSAGIAGKCDTTVFSEARILRLPMTENRKPKGITQCRLINGNIRPLSVDLYTLADMPSIQEGEHIHPRAYGRLPTPDAKAVQDGCGFLNYCRVNDTGITEPQWYAMLSIVGRLENGEKLIHTTYGPKGMKHLKYSPEVWDEKLRHALEASGPRTCSNISQLYDGCQKCPHYNKITSPIQIIGEDTIRTKESGFYEIIVTAQGIAKKGKPCYDDLVKWFKKTYTYVSIEQDRTVMVYNGTHWQEMGELKIHQFAEKNFNPTPVTSMCNEFFSKLLRTNPVNANVFNVQDKLNFQNGVLDLSTRTLMPHSDEYMFTYCIPYAYEPKGDCPVFKKFMEDISCGDKELEQLITEYVGYCISGADPELVQRCAILHGDGSNGKSVLISLMRAMVGMQNCSAIGVGSIKKETHRYQLMNKHFNAAAESPSDAFLDSETFKDMVAGGTVEVRKLYGDPIMWKCTTKLMFACNTLPFNGDFSHGLYRRLLIIPFNALFSDEKGNKDPLMLEKLTAERSDIFQYCLDAFEKTRQRGYKFIEPEAVKLELDDFREIGDIVGRFVYGMCGVTVALQNSHGVSLDTVYNLFAIWCKENNQQLISYGSFARRFGKALIARYPKIERIRPRKEGESRGTSYKYLTIKPMSAAVF